MKASEWAEEILRRITNDIPPAREIGQERFYEHWMTVVATCVAQACAESLTQVEDTKMSDVVPIIHWFRALTPDELEMMKRSPLYIDQIVATLCPIIKEHLLAIARGEKIVPRWGPPGAASATSTIIPPPPAAPISPPDEPRKERRRKVPSSQLIALMKLHPGGIDGCCEDVGISRATAYRLAKKPESNPEKVREIRQVVELARISVSQEGSDQPSSA